MTTSKFLTVLTIAVSATLAGCTVSHTPAPALQGPSTLGLALTITANPDVLSMNGSSQSQITIEARDPNGQLLSNVALRAEIVVNGAPADSFGSLSNPTPVTGSNGRASVTYTAPPFIQGSDLSKINPLSIRITPSGTDAANDVGRTVDIRLVPPGGIPGGGPNPSFTVTPTPPTAFADVIFDASGTTPALGTSIVSYSWNFGDGSSATGVLVHHQFKAAGTFAVVLTVTDSNGVSNSKTVLVTVGAGSAPHAAFTFSPTTPTINQQVNFNGGTSTAGSGHSLVSWNWDFGDGGSTVGTTVTHSYALANTYNVTLTVTDDAGQTSLATNPVTVSAAAGAGAPTSSFTFSPTSPAAGQPTHFNGSASTTPAGTTITNYAWDFGDGTTSPTNAGATIDHTFTTAGTFVVRLTVTNSSGLTGTSNQSVAVAGAPTSAFTYSPASPAAGQVTHFSGSASTTPAGTSITNYAWDFGDGVTSPTNASATIDHTFLTAGTFVVRLTVTNTAGLSNTSSQNVTVSVAGTLTAEFTMSPTNPTAGTTVNFNGSSSTAAPGTTITNYAWDFGDGATSLVNAGPTTTHAYGAAFTYTIRLTVTDSLGRTATVTHTLTVS